MAWGVVLQSGGGWLGEGDEKDSETGECGGIWRRISRPEREQDQEVIMPSHNTRSVCEQEEKWTPMERLEGVWRDLVKDIEDREETGSRGSDAKSQQEECFCK